MARRIINRKEKRAEYDAAERRKADPDEVDDVEEEAEEGDEEEAEEGDEEEAEEGDEEEAGERDEDSDDEEGVPRKRKAKAKPKAAPKPKVRRTRAAKITRMRVVWVVFNNSNQRIAEFDYPKRKEADEMAAKLTGDKKNTHFVQPVKVPIES